MVAGEDEVLHDLEVFGGRTEKRVDSREGGEDRDPPPTGPSGRFERRRRFSAPRLDLPPPPSWDQLFPGFWSGVEAFLDFRICNVKTVEFNGLSSLACVR